MFRVEFTQGTSKKLTSYYLFNTASFGVAFILIFFITTHTKSCPKIAHHLGMLMINDNRIDDERGRGQKDDPVQEFNLVEILKSDL